MYKYTTGPWEFDQGEDCGRAIIEDINGDFVADAGFLIEGSAHKENKEKAIANAKLIAAAPEMLEMLKECIRFINIGITEGGFRIKAANLIIKRSSALIAKAIGEENGND